MGDIVEFLKARLAKDRMDVELIPGGGWLILKPCIYAMAAIWAEHPDFDASWTVVE